MTLRKLANGAFHFTNELVSAGMVVKDKKTLEEFFEVYEDTLKMGGLKFRNAGESDSLIEEHLEPLKHMSTIISATHISGATHSIKSLLSQFGGDGFKLVQCVILCNPGMSKSEKQQNIDKVTKVYEQGVSQGIYNKEMSDLYKDFDIIDNSVNKTAIKKEKSTFWGRAR